jgi:hypothetical protein
MKVFKNSSEKRSNNLFYMVGDWLNNQLYFQPLFLAAILEGIDHALYHFVALELII